MLKLRKVQILGFKSFCDRTEVQLAGQGIAVIVGPNGCGKSNISDAITWVLGEQSAKSLRGIKMEDVIFAGTRERKATGMAEVSLTLVDPEVYDDAGHGPELVISEVKEAGRNVKEIAGDWDEAAARREAAEETEEAVAEAQPGTTYEAPGGKKRKVLHEHSTPEEIAAAAEAIDEDEEERGGHPNHDGPNADATLAADPNNVVLKIRRRKFGRAPIRAGEITITRRLFRTGDSEYLLNGKICRLRDIQDIFMGTGLGGETYAIIGQERIGQLLSSKPLERRSIIEEAAGITRFKTKKRLAELRLESAKLNLSRVNDIFEEVTKQMMTLKRQAAKAERYGALRDELRGKLRIVLASRLAQMDTEQTSISAEIHRLAAQIDEQAAALELMDTEHSTGIARGYELDQQIREAAARANQSAVELERIAARTTSNADRVADLTQRLATGEEELGQARTQLETLAGEREQHRSFLENATSEAEGSRANAQQQQQAAQEAFRAVSAAEQKTEEQRRNAMHIMQRAAQASNEEAQAGAALSGLERENERLASESEIARTELDALGLQRTQIKMSFEGVTERLQRLEAEINELRQTMEARRGEETQSKRRGDELRGELATLLGRRGSLEALIREHSYSTDTVRNIFRVNAQRANSPQGNALGAVGTLADFLEVDGKYESVVDEFLRDELNYIVVKSWDAADAGMAILQSDVAGRATFLVHGENSSGGPFIASSSDAMSGERTTPEGAIPLRDCIRVLNGFGDSLASILPKLRDGYVTPDSASARALAQQYPQAFFLAPSGETFHNVTVTGGKPREQGPLALKRELNEVQKRITGVEAELAKTDLATLALQRELTELTAELDRKNHERRDAERESANSGAALRQMEAETARIERRIQEWQAASERNQAARAQKQELIARKQAEAAQHEAQRTEIEGQIAELNSQIGTLRANREELQQAAAAAAAALAGLEERRRNANANFEQTARLYAGQEQRIVQLSQQLSTAAAERQRREEETAQLATQHEQLTELRAQATAEGATLSAQATKLRTQMTELDAKLRSLRHETEDLRETRAQLSARAAKLTSDVEHMEHTCINDLSVEPANLREDATIQRIEAEALAAEEESARALKQRLEAMGPVNMMALEEYTETASRHTFLETQRKDLIDSIENTQASIKEIDEVSREKFDQAFKVINDNFSTSFSKLFGGGQAFMRLTDEVNTAESGIDIVASPPGKKLQNVLLLSGGEKALTALSLLVGIFQFQPAPFCILDEVDAPLDDTNVGRFARLIAEMAETTQFVVITHSKRTMEQADVMYGVTMQEPGVSKIVSVSLGGRMRDQRAVA
ncbi:MAG TPA: chromosome segregation protein SMC [Acidobacteriaceae bacterium]